MNPFSFGDLALAETFTNRDGELSELEADIRNGQNVVIFAPRRYGKSSLLERAAEHLRAEDILIAQVDLMRTASKEQLAATLARAVYEQIASPLERVRDRAVQVFRGLRIVPAITIDPLSGAVGFNFSTGHEPADVDATIERLLELPAELSSDRGRQVALVFDEFQEVLDFDPRLPSLMRSVFQNQPQVAHVYAGSKRSMMRRLFNDENEPFWRSAKQLELGVISVDAFAPFIRDRFASTDRSVSDRAVERVLAVTSGHPYATQELCYALWQQTSDGRLAAENEFQAALELVLRSETAHFTRIWDRASSVQRLVMQALAAEPARALTSGDYRRRHGLPAVSSVQKAVSRLIADELVEREGPGAYRIAEPFLAEWVRRFGS